MKTALDIRHCVQAAIEADATFIIIIYDAVESEQFAQYVSERPLAEAIQEIDEVYSYTILTIYAVGITNEQQLSEVEQEIGYRVNGLAI